MAVQGKVFVKDKHSCFPPTMVHGTKQVDCLCKWLCSQVDFTYQYQLETQILGIFLFNLISIIH
jgi:hypothetical protein